MTEIRLLLPIISMATYKPLFCFCFFLNKKLEQGRKTHNMYGTVQFQFLNENL